MGILPSHRQGLYFLERCRVMAKDDRIVYAQEEKGCTKFVSIPRANTNAILLGPGTSITQAAARMMSEEGVMLGFTGGGGTPVYLASQSEYRPTEYLQSWVSFWFEEEKRLLTAKQWQHKRAEFLYKTHKKLEGPKPSEQALSKTISDFAMCAKKAKNTNELLGYEAGFAKSLYRLWAAELKVDTFTREPGKNDKNDLFNSYLDHGNYLAYGLAATALWVMGLPHSLPLFHGKTRRGALVFDAADLIKDATIMPIAFQSAIARIPSNQMRGKCIAWLEQTKALGYMLDVVKESCAGLK